MGTGTQQAKAKKDKLLMEAEVAGMGLRARIEQYKIPPQKMTTRVIGGHK